MTPKELDDLEIFVLDHVEKIRSKKVISGPEAEQRAGEFLYAVGMISNARRRINDDRILIETQTKVKYAQAIGSAEGKNVTEKKINAECNPDYTDTYEILQRLEGIITYLKTQEKVFENAHIFYRNLYRGAN